MVHLFVYGTLQPNLAPPSIKAIVDRFEFIARARTPGKLYDLGDYPGAIFEDVSTTDVHGVVYAVSDEGPLWQALDEYEGVPSLYVRVRRPVTLSDDTTIDCWAYAYVRPVALSQLIPGGRYRR